MALLEELERGLEDQNENPETPEEDEEEEEELEEGEEVEAPKTDEELDEVGFDPDTGNES
ncbi:MAG: hypothetical protein HYW97_01185 [Candidatus Wildermuthbacteria bacterium]|nr:hypothetical protein [Candidatus Wildermuthbacteria bacterium]